MVFFILRLQHESPFTLDYKLLSVDVFSHNHTLKCFNVNRLKCTQELSLATILAKRFVERESVRAFSPLTLQFARWRVI